VVGWGGAALGGLTCTLGRLQASATTGTAKSIPLRDMGLNLIFLTSLVMISHSIFSMLFVENFSGDKKSHQFIWKWMGWIGQLLSSFTG
jgi:hypothetical protein